MQDGVCRIILHMEHEAALAERVLTASVALLTARGVKKHLALCGECYV